MSELITGAGGFLGRRLLRNRLSHGKRVVAVDRCQAPEEFSNDDRVRWIQRDLSRGALTAEETEGVATVFHLAGATLGAGTDAQMFCQANEATTVGILGSFQGRPPRFVHASSQVVYGNVDDCAVTEDFPMAGYDSAYACSKLNAENWIRFFVTSQHGTAVILRFCGFIEGGGAIDYMIDRALANEPIQLFARGTIKRDYLPVGQAIDAFAAAAAFDAPRGVSAFNIGSGQAMSALELAKLVIKESNSSSPIELLEKVPARLNFVFDISSAATLLGFKPNSLEECVKIYVRERASSYADR